MKILLLLVAAFAFKSAECGVADFLADRALARIASWVNAEGASCATLSGVFASGVVEGQTNNNYTLAVAGPAFVLTGGLTRSSEATLTNEVADPNYDTNQRLTFNVTLKNVTVKYAHIAYNDDLYGFYNLTANATSDGVTATMNMDIKGSGDSCMGFLNDAAVLFNGNIHVTTGGSLRTFPVVVDAVTNHFKENIPNGIQILLKTAALNGLNGYDICTGVFNPFPQANFLAGRIVYAMQDGLNHNFSSWAILPGFWYGNAGINGTSDEVFAQVGSFKSMGNLKRYGGATYTNYYYAGGEKITLNFTIETSKVVGNYTDIKFTTVDGQEYHVAEEVEAGRMRTEYTLRFETNGSEIVCGDLDHYATSQYMTEDEVYFTMLGDKIPMRLFSTLYDMVSEGFTESISSAAEDYILNLGKASVDALCIKLR